MQTQRAVCESRSDGLPAPASTTQHITVKRGSIACTPEGQRCRGIQRVPSTQSGSQSCAGACISRGVQGDGDDGSGLWRQGSLPVETVRLDDEPFKPLLPKPLSKKHP